MLFVDDEPIQQERFQDAVSDWNAANAQKTFEPVILSGSASAIEALTHARFDCALFDLKLATGEGTDTNLSGNRLAKIGLEDVGMPVGIISGYPEDVAEDLAQRHLVRAFRKTPGAFGEAVSWLGGMWDMMEVLGATRRRIRKSGAEIFAGRIWPRWQAYRDVALAGSSLEPIVTRQYAAHIAELMGLDGGENPEWHPLEAYLLPALHSDRIHTGDIFREEGSLWVVLSPPCDMAADVTDVLLAKCATDLNDQDPSWQSRLEQLRNGIAAGQIPAKVGKYFRDLVNQNIEVSKHFLPPLDGHPLRVDFKQLQVRPLADLQAELDQRIASVAPAFLTNLTQRFGAYISRTGQPNISIDHFADAEPAIAAGVG
jgi:hypothetical protein